MYYDQEIDVEFGCEPENERFARMVVAAYALRLDPTLEELADIKTAVSEAVTNSILHGYYGISDGRIRLKCSRNNEIVEVVVSDSGVGIDDIDKAMEPMFTTRPELDRSGMGFAFMEAFMDKVTVESTPGKGTTVKMSKKITKENALYDEDPGIPIGCC